ncbi:MAG: PhnD/SsuA/transferrin family substrate-binding protein [Gammaproteobacteria bacterium]|nr:PhnD/SsuA/transferrin family substrate-binding protein [Gammaproteobacteria bacterium]
MKTLLSIGFFCFLLFSCSLLADEADIKIGVLSHRGEAATRATWSPTADYLTHAIKGYRFEIVPLNFSQVDPAVASGTVDFVLVNPGIYVNLEVRYRVSRIATLNNQGSGVPYNVFGGVIFTRADREDIKRLSDLVGKRLMAVDKTSLGGFQMAWRELQQQGINPYQDLAEVRFAGIHDRVVQAVLAGEVDVGTVRTDILERMAADGLIQLDQFRIIHSQHHEHFLYVHSSSLYPEWPFSKVNHTSAELAQRVALALLNMPLGHRASQTGHYTGWTFPLNYQPVHDLFKELHLAPYDSMGKFTIWDAVRQYWHWLLIGLLFLLFMVVMILWVLRLNRALKVAQSRLQHQHELILDSVSDGIYGVDLEGNSTFLNRAMERITGWNAEDLIGKNQHQILHHTHADGSHFPDDECPVYQTYKDNQPRFIADDTFWKKDGSCFSVEYSSTPLKDEQGKTVGSVVVFRDISLRKGVEAELRQHQQELAHVARLSTMGEMVSGIAHEINQPLTAIATNAQALIRCVESGQTGLEQFVDVMERIVNQATHAGEVIRELRSFVRKEPPQLLLIDLSQVVREATLLFSTEIHQAGIKLELQLGAVALINAQRIQIEQVILNLARNAIEAMSDELLENKRLLIRVRMRNSQQVELSVRDSGPGLSHLIEGQLFDPFVTTKEKGMGLGLSISHSIIEHHGGTLSVVSHTEGVTFVVILPIAELEKGEKE